MSTLPAGHSSVRLRPFRLWLALPVYEGTVWASSVARRVGLTPVNSDIITLRCAASSSWALASRNLPSQARSLPEQHTAHCFVRS
jgi:hypothetical protein